MRMFDGPPRHLRQIFSAEARSPGLFNVLGTIISHSIAQVGIGFPYLSPLCYGYLAHGEEYALQQVTLTDVRAVVASVITQVGRSLYSWKLMGVCSFVVADPIKCHRPFSMNCIL